jgi:biotin synthase
MQAGEDTGITREWLADVIRAVKSETPLAVTLSMGERDDLELQTWRAAGADRYLLRFETSDPELYDRIHPAAPSGPDLNRVEILLRLRELGYETGSGVMVGVPGQSYAMLARDITLFKRLDLDMIGLGPYISHPDTPLGRQARPLAPGQQVPNTDAITYKALALTRLARPDANIPATTALATVNKTSGRELGLRRGANVVMPNLTPAQYRRLYAIYPDKAGAEAGTEAFHRALLDRLEAIGRRPGQGRGDRPGAPASTQFRHFK